MTGDKGTECEFLIKVRRKPDRRLVELCSLTGKTCWVNGADFHDCTRRQFSLNYQPNHPVNEI